MVVKLLCCRLSRGLLIDVCVCVFGITLIVFCTLKTIVKKNEAEYIYRVYGTLYN